MAIFRYFNCQTLPLGSINTEQKEMTVTKIKKIALDGIPDIQEKIVGLINKEVETLSDKEQLTIEDTKTLISFSQALAVLYKDFRAECLTIEKDLKTRPKEQLLSIIKAEI